MRSGLIMLILLLVAAINGQQNPALRNELLEMEKVDQDARFKCMNRSADEQIKCLAVINDSIDVPHTKRLEAIFSQYGFPSTEMVGKDGLQALMIVLQHAPTDGLRLKALRPITKAFKNKELPPMAYANFVDRLRLHQGKKQLYGTGFEFKDGKMELSPTNDLKNLEKRRIKIGLPPMTEAIKMMKELYHLEVVVPNN